MQSYPTDETGRDAVMRFAAVPEDELRFAVDQLLRPFCDSISVRTRLVARAYLGIADAVLSHDYARMRETADEFDELQRALRLWPADQKKQLLELWDAANDRLDNGMESEA